MAKRNKKLKREQRKAECERCGFTYNMSELVRQRGVRVCRICYDEPGYMER